MGLFNNLRHHIVERLIRPEDGYIHIGLSGGEPIRFYYDKKHNKYIISMCSESGHYFEPTLTGWSVIDAYDIALEKVDFQKWIYGILNNVYNQYSESLDRLSLREIRHISEFTKGEKEVNYMINKQSFCEIINGLDEYQNSMRNLENILNVYFDENMMTEIFDTVVDALEEDLEPNLGIGEDLTIYRWFFEMNAGQNEAAKIGIDGHPLTSAEELYDYLIWKRDEKNISKNA